MSKQTDVMPKETGLYLLPVQTRVPLKFGHETLTAVTCARVRMRIEDAAGRSSTGWGETPLAVQWVWPSLLPYDDRNQVMIDFCKELARAWALFPLRGHPMEIGHAFQLYELPKILASFNQARDGKEPMPWLAALVCCSVFDIALHDAYGVHHEISPYQTYNADFMNTDLGDYISDDGDDNACFAGKYPEEFLVRPNPQKLPAWHLVGGKDPVDQDELTGSEPDDGYPVLLGDWIRRDGLKCLKVKLRGNDAQWDYARLVKVGRLAIEENVDWLTSDFNCTVDDPLYVNEILDRLMVEEPRIWGMLLYVEQPFPYDLEKNQIDVHSVSARKPLFMDESAHDWRLVKLGRQLGWTGVALKTCKTQTGALLTLCWAKAHGMTLMVQDLSNPMLAQIPHALLASFGGTIMGVETNSMQFYPEASRPEEAVHPGLYRRRNGLISLDSVHGPGFGYRIAEIQRELPTPVQL